jgi:hypothetical protein
MRALLRMPLPIMVLGLSPALASAEGKTVRDWTEECGTTGEWVWSGYSFRLVQFSAWLDCENGKNSDDRPVIYAHQAK